MSELVISTWVVGSELPRTLQIIRELGFHLVELLASPAVPEYDLRAERVAGQVWEMVAAEGMQVYSVHNAFGPEWDLATPVEAERELALANHAALLRAAGRLGAQHTVLHAGELLPDEPATTQLERLLRSLERLLPVAEEAGVLVALENLPPDHLANSPGQIRWLLDRLDPAQAGFCCDTGHAELGGTPPGAFVREFGDRLLGLHLQDTHGDEDAHLFPGLGRVDWEDLFAALWELDYRLPLTLEACPPPEMPWEEAARIAGTAARELRPFAGTTESRS